MTYMNSSTTTINLKDENNIFQPAENAQIDENTLNKIAEYLNVPVGTIEVLNILNHFFWTNRSLVFSQDGFIYSHDTSNYIAWFQLNCLKDENTADGLSKKLDIVRYKVDEDVRDIPID